MVCYTKFKQTHLLCGHRMHSHLIGLSDVLNRVTSIRSMVSTWVSRTVTNLQGTFSPVTCLVNVVAFCLFPIARWCAVSASSCIYKWKMNVQTLAESRKTLTSLGGHEVNLTAPDGHTISGMYFNLSNCLTDLCRAGAVSGEIPLSNGSVQDILYLPTDDSLWLATRMGVDVETMPNGSQKYICVGVPRSSNTASTGSEQHHPGTVLYATGSGHIYEWRRKTIGTFLFSYGMNVMVFHYSGTGRSQGSATEQNTYDDVEACYRYLTETQQIDPNKILGYGHCSGGGPILHLAARHPIHVFADRTFETTGKLAALRVKVILNLPTWMRWLTAWIEPVMNKCFHYNNEENIKKVRGSVITAWATEDKMIPASYVATLFNNAMQARDKMHIDMNTEHDPDFGTDRVARNALINFLIANNLIR